MSDIKNCPFCGGPPDHSRAEEYGQTRCDDHRCIPGATHWFLVKDWNRRATSPAIVDLVKACRALNEFIDVPPWHDKGQDVYFLFYTALEAVEKEIK